MYFRCCGYYYYGRFPYYINVQIHGGHSGRTAATGHRTSGHSLPPYANKSLVDIKLTARACQEHYQKQVDSFVIVSSDSDYWGLISSLPDARFLVMIEREKCGPDMKAALAESGIFYCYLDDFYSGNSEDIKKNALFKEMYRWIDNSVHLNVNDMFDAALRNTRIEMSPAERRQFYEKHIRHMTLTIDENGNVSIELKRG